MNESEANELAYKLGVQAKVKIREAADKDNSAALGTTVGAFDLTGRFTQTVNLHEPKIKAFCKEYSFLAEAEVWQEVLRHELAHAAHNASMLGKIRSVGDFYTSYGRKDAAYHRAYINLMVGYNSAHGQHWKRYAKALRATPYAHLDPVKLYSKGF